MRIYFSDNHFSYFSSSFFWRNSSQQSFIFLAVKFFCFLVFSQPRPREGKCDFWFYTSTRPTRVLASCSGWFPVLIFFEAFPFRVFTLFYTWYLNSTFFMRAFVSSCNNQSITNQSSITFKINLQSFLIDQSTPVRAA